MSTLILNREVLKMHKELGMSSEDIAADTGLETTAVKNLVEKREHLSSEEIAEATEVIMDIARNGADDSVRLKAAIYLRDDGLGRFDRKPETDSKKGLNVSILMINEGLRKLRGVQEAGNSMLPGQPRKELVFE